MTLLGLIGLSILLVSAVVCDLRHRRVPNQLILAGLVSGLLIASLPGSHGLASAVLGVVTGMALLMPFYWVKGVAAGDVKLMGASGAFLGPAATLESVMWTFLAGGAMALIWQMGKAWHGAKARGRPAFSTHAVGEIPLQIELRPRERIRHPGHSPALPYALAIACGVLACVLIRVPFTNG